MNTNIATKTMNNEKKVEIVSPKILIEGLNKKDNTNLLFGNAGFKIKKTDKFNEIYILDLIKINVEATNLLKEFVNEFGKEKSLEEKEEILKKCYFNFQKKKVFKFKENLRKDIQDEFKPLNFENILDIYIKYIFRNLKKYKYFYFFLYLLNSSNKRSQSNNININLPIILQSIFAFFEIKDEKVKLYSNKEQVKAKLKEKLELWVKKREIGTTYEEFTVRWNFKRVTKNITDDYVKEVNKVSIKDYENYSEMRNPYLQKSLYLVNIISLDNMFTYFDFLNEIIKECFFVDNLVERMALKKGIIYRYEKDFFENKKLTKEKYDILKSVERELVKERKKIW